jgi:hypothetical protein
MHTPILTPRLTRLPLGLNPMNVFEEGNDCTAVQDPLYNGAW